MYQTRLLQAAGRKRPTRRGKMQDSYRASRLRAGVAVGVVALVAAVALWIGMTPARAAHAASAPGVTSVSWGSAHGRAVRLYTLTSGRGMTVKVTNYGAIIQS